MAASCGFEVLEISTNEYESENLFDMDLYIRKPYRTAKLPSLSKSNMIKEIHRELLNFKYITIWGAGNNSHFYGDLLSRDITIKHIIDGAPNRKDQFINNLNLRVESIKPDIIKASDAIIIFAPSFNKEIIKLLREDFIFKGKIVFFQDGMVHSYSV
jgi:hypothetical protein